MIKFLKIMLLINGEIIFFFYKKLILIEIYILNILFASEE